MQLPDATIPEMHRNPNGPSSVVFTREPNEGLGPTFESHRYDNVPDLNVLFEPPTSIKWKAWRWVFFFIGGAFVIYGIIGSLVPVLPGFPFLVVGLPIMAASNETARRWANKLEQRLPLKTRMLLRKYKPTLPPKGATREQMRYWRKKTAFNALLFCGSVGFFTGVGYGTTWLVKTYL